MLRADYILRATCVRAGLDLVLQYANELPAHVANLVTHTPCFFTASATPLTAPAKLLGTSSTTLRTGFLRPKRCSFLLTASMCAKKSTLAPANVPTRDSSSL